MYKNLNPESLGVAGRQSELIELTLTYGFRGLDVDAGDLLKRASLLGVEEATRYLRSANVKVGGLRLPVALAADEEGFKNDLERLSKVTDTAKQRVAPDPWHAGENLVAQIPTGEWVERAPYFEAVAVTGDGVFETLRAVSKLVLKTLS